MNPIEHRIIIQGFGHESLQDRQEAYPYLPRCVICQEPMMKQLYNDKRCGYCRAKNNEFTEGEGL